MFWWEELSILEDPGNSILEDLGKAKKEETGYRANQA